MIDIRYAQIRSMDISNSEGISVSLFVQGCDFHCKGCFNSETWDWNGGKEFAKEQVTTILNLCNKPHIKSFCILGGEPLHPRNIDVVTELCKTFKEQYPNKKIWIWTGYTFETYVQNLKVLNYVDVVIDGQFEFDKKDFKLKHRGSSNQRIWKLNNGKWSTDGKKEI